MTQMQELARPFPDKYVHTNPSGGGSYVKHHVVEQRLIQVLGIPPRFTKVEIIFGDVAAIAPNPNGNSKRAKEGRPELKNVIVAVVCRMGAVIDDEQAVVEEAGDCESPHNWDTDGQRLKDAMSDAYKRCAMRLGCGLHLWSQDEYFLFDKLSEKSEESKESGDVEPVVGWDTPAEVEEGSAQGPNVEAAVNEQPSEATASSSPDAPAGQGSLVAPAPGATPEELRAQLRKAVDLKLKSPDGRLINDAKVRALLGKTALDLNMTDGIPKGDEEWPTPVLLAVVDALGLGAVV